MPLDGNGADEETLLFKQRLPTQSSSADAELSGQIGAGPSTDV